MTTLDAMRDELSVQNSTEEQMLLPIMVSFIPRSGSTLLMSNLATDRNCFFDRTHPYEKHLLSYLAKISDVLTRPDLEQVVESMDVVDLFNPRLESLYIRHPGERSDISFSRNDTFKALWQSASSATRLKCANARLYAEKCPIWVPFFVRKIIPSITISLFRDPRNVFLSQIAYIKKQPNATFGLKDPSELTRSWLISTQLNSLFESTQSVQHEDSIISAKYEEISQDMTPLFKELEKRARFCPTDLPDKTFYESHATTSLSASQDRWKRDVISKRIQDYLQLLNFQAMQTLGYEVTISKDEAASIEVDLTNPANFEVEHGELEEVSPASGIVVTSRDSRCSLKLSLTRKRPGKVMEIWLCVSGGAGTVCRLSWRGIGKQFTEERSYITSFRTCNHYHVVRFRTCEHPHWDEDFAQLRVENFLGDDSSDRPTTTKIKWIKLIPEPQNW